MQNLSFLNKFFLLLINFYRNFISPFLGPRCRYYPSCSEYGIQVFKCFPIHKALWYSGLRILRCHPFAAGGYDPAPCNCEEINSEHRSE